MSPLLKKVENIGIQAVKQKAKPYQIKGQDFFTGSYNLKSLFSQLIGASADSCVIIPSVSYGMANAANNLKRKKGEIIILDEQFPSNVYPWMSKYGYSLKIIEAPKENKCRGKKWNEKLLESINTHTVAVAIPQTHWADGTLMDLISIRKRTEEVEAALIIDGTQSVGALPFSVEQIRPDALVCAGYKWLMGPYSIGMAYYGPYFDNGVPIENNWINRLGAEKFSDLTAYQNEYAQGASRYEVGERSNFILVPMLSESIKQIINWTPEAIQSYCEELMKPAHDLLNDRGFMVPEPNERASHLFGIRHNNLETWDRLKTQLDQLRIFYSVRGSAIRLSPHVYNQPKDIMRLIRAIEASVK